MKNLLPSCLRIRPFGGSALIRLTWMTLPILKLQNALSQNYTLVSFGGVGKMPLWKATDGASGTTHGRAAALSNIASSLVLNNNQTLATAKSHVASDGSSKPEKGKGKSKPKSKYAPNRMITGF